MVKRTARSSPKMEKAESVTVSPARKTAAGQEVWLVHKGGRRERVITTGTSAATMDDAVTIYSGALKRLAKR
jgi:hypothetical protein